MNKLKIILMLLALFTVTGISANDTTGIIMPTGNIEFKKQNDIQMETEALFIKDGQIQVNYLFSNTSKKDVSDQVFFPLPPFDAVESYMGYDNQNHNFNFKCYINGKEQKVEESLTISSGGTDLTKYFKKLFPDYYSQISTTQLSEYIDNMSKKDREFLINNNIIKDGFVTEEDKGWEMIQPLQKNVSFYWKQSFPAGKTVHVKHVYTPTSYSNSIAAVNSKCIDSDNKEFKKFITSEGKINSLYDNRYPALNYLEYILHTGANWKGPIKNFNLLVQGPLKVTGCFEDKPFYSKDRYFAKNLTDFTPSKNLTVDFVFPGTDSDKKPQSYEPKLYKIDGPAMARATPNGKRIDTLPDGAYVWVVGQEAKWYQIVYNNLRAWTYQDNLIDIWNQGAEDKPAKPVLVTDANFDKEVTKYKGPIMVEFFANWCGHCKNMAPLINQIAKEYGDKVKIVIVDVDQAPQASSDHNITGIPAMFFYKSKNNYKKLSGAQSIDNLRKHMDELSK